MPISYKTTGESDIRSFSLSDLRDYAKELLFILRDQWTMSNQEIRVHLVLNPDDPTCAWHEATHPHYISEITVNLSHLCTPNDMIQSLCHEFCHVILSNYVVFTDNVLSVLPDDQCGLFIRLSHQANEQIAMRLADNVEKLLLARLRGGE